MLMAVVGCASAQPTNPSFPTTIVQARAVLQECRAHKVALDRPLVIVGGYLDPGLGPAALKKMFSDVTGDKRILSISLGAVQSFDDARQRIVEAVEQAFPSSDPTYTTPVDVIGISMGGIAPRYAARHDPQSNLKLKRLNIVRLFTISSPHQGATAAQIHVVISGLQLDMRPDSDFIRRLNSHDDPLEPMYAVYPYVRLGDQTVGPEHAAPPGQKAWWVGGMPASTSHSMSVYDPRILADIALRLRNGTPLATDPASPVPGRHDRSTAAAPVRPATMLHVP